MSIERAQNDECYILIKAQPHRSSSYFETVCCAGIGRDGKWRRQYPVPFRILGNDQKFSRWSLIQYSYTRSKKDPRKESQKVVPESIVVAGKLKQTERTNILAPLLRASFDEANSLRESLTLLRPKQLEISGIKKSLDEILAEERKHHELARQLSMFDDTAKPMKICPVAFRVKWQDQAGKLHSHECDDWETSAAYNRFERLYGHEKAILSIREKYEDQYFKAGLALAFSTHSRRNIEFKMQNQWLLVGLIRVDETSQTSFL